MLPAAVLVRVLNYSSCDPTEFLNNLTSLQYHKINQVLFLFLKASLLLTLRGCLVSTTYAIY